MSEPRHAKISRELLKDIAAGKYGPGARLPSEAQLCKKFGVSRPTVHTLPSRNCERRASSTSPRPAARCADSKRSMVTRYAATNRITRSVEPAFVNPC